MENDEIEVELNVKGRKIKIRGSNLTDILSQLDNEVSKTIERILTKIEPVNSDVDSNSLQFIIKNFKPKSFYDKILTCIYYLHKRGNTIFNQNELRETFMEALFPLPKNTIDLLNKLETKGFVAVHREKRGGLKSWYITQEGLEYVERGFEQEVDK